MNLTPFASWRCRPHIARSHRWVAGGQSNASIAALLDVRPGTVKRHLENIYRKLGVASRSDAAALVALMPRTV